MTTYRISMLDCNYRKVEVFDGVEVGEIDAVLVLRVPRHWTAQARQEMREAVQRMFPGRQVLIINDGAAFMRLEEDSAPQNAWPLVTLRWLEDGACFDCPCGIKEIVVNEDSVQCTCGRVYSLRQDLTVEVPHG